MSALSPIGICKRALLRCGVTTPISSIEDPETEEEIVCAECYDDIRLDVLTMHPWNFAKERRQIIVARRQNL